MSSAAPSSPSPRLRVVGVVGSPTAGGRTDAAVAAILSGCTGAETSQVSLADTAVEDVLAAMAAADAVVLGSPTYRGSFSSLLRSLLEQTQRGRYGETSAPLRGTAAAVVMTAGSAAHYLALGDLRSVLAGFFGVQVLSPGLVLGPDHFSPEGVLNPDSAALAAAHGRALLDLAAVVRASAAIAALEPQV